MTNIKAMLQRLTKRVKKRKHASSVKRLRSWPRS